jgi:hypothetical protein
MWVGTTFALLLGSIFGAHAASDDVHYACDLSDNEEIVATYSPGKGRAEFALERATNKLSWRVSFENLTTPLQSAGAYGPDRPAGTAGLQFSLSTGGVKSPIVGSKILSDIERQYLAAGRIYVNLITSKYAGGELRCQLKRLRETPPP